MNYINCYNILICLILLCGISTTYADQLNTSKATPIIRHVQGMKSIGMHLGGTSIGIEGALVGDYHFSPEWKASIGLGGAVDRINENRYHNGFLQPLLGLTLYTDHKRCSIRVLGGTKMHRESYQSKKERRQEKKRNYTGNLGLVGGGEVALFLTKHVSLIGSGGLRVFLKQNDLAGRSDYFFNIGFRVSL